jgi:hypothetical protein
MTLRNVEDPSGDGSSISQVGAMLFTRGVSGTRVLTGKENKFLEGHHFQCEYRQANDMCAARGPYLHCA